VNRVADALAHLLVAIQSREARKRREQRFGLFQEGSAAAEHVVEPAHRLARQLEMRDLILANRHEFRVVHRDVGSLQERIAEKANRGQILVLQVFLLLLVRRHPLEPRHWHDHRQQQEQLGVLGHQRLDEKRALLRIEPGADPVGDVFIGERRQLTRVGEVAGQRVPVGDEIETVVARLQRHPVAQRADQMSEMQSPGRPHAGHDTCPSC
jgi:hypothetical protein